MVSKETAKEILEVFGPCTMIYECMSIRDIQAEVAETPIAEYLQWRLSLEYNALEGAFAHMDPLSSQWDELAKERREMTAQIIQRVNDKFGVELKNPGGEER